LQQAVGLPPEQLCGACFTGNYPISINADADKLALEPSAVGHAPSPIRFQPYTPLRPKAVVKKLG
jgi:hypothetical protein